jgi:hypothetical protein
MSKTVITFLSIGAVLFVTAIVLVLSGVSIYNDAASVKNTYEMKVKSNEAEFDNMWKKIQQVAQVPDAQKDAFKEVYSSYASSRTSPNQGQMMAWIKESVPNYNGEIYTQLMNVITGSRDGWTMRQNELVDVARQYNANLVVFPKNILLKFCGFEKIEPKVITSTKTEQSFKTGKDDDVELFNKKK